MKPTPEQQAIVDAFAKGQALVIEAGAGTGKTSTLDLLGRATGKRCLYVAYNKSIASDASKRFSANVTCSTAHSLAYRSVGHRYRPRLDGKRMPAREIARLLECQPCRVTNAENKTVVLDAVRVARLAMSGVERFCRSREEQIAPWMIRAPEGIEGDAEIAALREHVFPYTRKAWDDLVDPEGALPFAHDVYLKIWALSRPKLHCDVLFLDEAQDADPLIADVVMRQEHAQRVLVGDRCQAIYGWRGAVNAMEEFELDARLLLTQSFRFGQAIADEANKWLEILKADLRLRGFERIKSRVADLHRPDAVLCRTNAGAVTTIMHALDHGRRAALVGGGQQIRRLAEAAITLQANAGTDHPELMAFRTWDEVKEYAESDSAGSDIKVFVSLIDRHGAESVIRTVERLVPENRADLIVSTAHKAKGREWSTVRVHDDFREPPEDGDGPTREESMLAYVTVTRAKQTLDRFGLEWVDDWLP